MKKEQEFSPMICQVPNGNEIPCKDCIHRDRTTVTVDNKVLPVGVTKANCDMFVYPERKPSPILFNGASCDFYEEE